MQTVEAQSGPQTPVTPLQFSLPPLPQGIIGQPWTTKQPLAAGGGVAPYAFAVGPNMTAGFTISAGGFIVCAAIPATPYNIDVICTDSTNN